MEQLIVVGRGHHFYPEVSHTDPITLQTPLFFQQTVFCYTIIL